MHKKTDDVFDYEDKCGANRMRNINVRENSAKEISKAKNINILIKKRKKTNKKMVNAPSVLENAASNCHLLG